MGSAGAAPLRGAAEKRPGRRERGVLAVLGGLLALCLVGLLLELGRNARLSAKIGQLSAELAATRTAVSAHEARLDEVRGAVARLSALVQGDPVAAPATQEP